MAERQLPKLHTRVRFPSPAPAVRQKHSAEDRPKVSSDARYQGIRWKLFKPLREIALERFCEQVLDEVSRISSDGSKSKHERYLAIYRLMRERDKEIDPIFDTLRRSTAVRQLCSFRSCDLVTEQELQQLSPELRKSVENILEIYNRPMEIVDEDDLSLERDDD